jgi:hypothetical protein
MNPHLAMEPPDMGHPIRGELDFLVKFDVGHASDETA